MTFTDIQNKTVLTNFLSTADEATILAAMKTAYEGSAIAREMIDSWILRGNTIPINFENDGFGVHDGKLQIDLNWLNKSLYIDNNGTARQDTAVGAITHELVHLLTGRSDNVELFLSFAVTDYKQPTVTFTNYIFRELGIPEQNSYIGADAKGILTLGFQYTKGAEIDRSVVLNSPWDSSAAGNSRDLLIGGASGNLLIAGDGNDFLYGNDGEDTLNGGRGNDLLVGGLQNDTLNGGQHSDRLEGGAGIDTYTIEANSGIDTILDTDGAGAVVWGGVTLAGGEQLIANYWLSADGQMLYALQGSTLVVTNSQSTGSVRIENWSTTSNLGITLSNQTPNSTAPQNLDSTNGRPDVVNGSLAAENISTGLRPDLVMTYGGNDRVFLGAGNDRGYGNAGNDWIEGQEDNDYIYGGQGANGTAELAADDKDTVIGGAGNDLLNGGIGDDRLIAGNQADNIDAAGLDTQGDWLLGSYGNDTVFGSTARDMLNGGSGSDVLVAGSGDDIVLGDANYDFVVSGSYVTNYTGSIADAAEHNFDPVYSVKAADGFTVTNSSAFQFTSSTNTTTISGETDFTFTPTLARASGQVRIVTDVAGVAMGDVLFGGAGNDWMAGQTGDDQLFGGEGNDILYGDDITAAKMAEADQGNDFIDGGAGMDRLFGGAGNDVLQGGSGDDQLLGQAGQDELFGEDGADSLDGGDDIDLLFGGIGNDTLKGGEQADLLEGNADNDSLQGDAGNDVLNGGAGNDTLLGGAGADTLNGGTGLDDMQGGEGDDSYVLAIGDDVNVVSKITDASGNNVLQLTGGEFKHMSLTDSGTGWTLHYSLNDTVQLSGSFKVSHGTASYTLDDLQIEIETDKIILNGSAGADLLSGGDGNDYYYVDNAGDVVSETNPVGGIDTVYSSLSAYTLTANVENGRILTTGTASLTGNELNNVLYADAGNNVLDGLAGTDTASYQYATAAVTVGLATTAAQITGGSGSDTLRNIENLTGSSYADKLTGNEGSNVLIGGLGNDTLDSGLGADTMSGGADNDTYVVDSALDVVTEAAAEGTDTVQSSVTYALGAEVENLTLTGTGAINATGNTLANVLTGNSAANTLTGDAGNDTLTGGLGADAMSGGAGNDTYVVDNALDAVTEVAAEGIDTVQSTITYTLGAEVENLTLTGTGVINGTGNALANVLTGNSAANVLTGDAGNDTLNGSTGADTMTGGNGNDTYYVDNSNDSVIELAGGGTDRVNSYLSSYTLADNVEYGRIMSSGAANLAGNSLSNTLYAGSGDNVLNGGSGTDTVSYYYATAGVTVSLAQATVQATGGSGSDTLVSVERLTGSNYNDTLTGNTGNNILNGGTGNDLLDGGAGNDSLIGGAGDDILEDGAGVDTMAGGAGDDTYQMENIGDRVVELASEGTDLIYSALNAYTLEEEVENATITLTTGASLTGNSLVNALTGNAGDDILDGGTGADAMTGGNGNDTYSVDNSNDSVMELASGGTDRVNSYLSTYTLAANVENGTIALDTGASLTGNSLNNELTGGVGNDTLNGSTGADAMTGGNGSDTYYVDNINDSVIELASGGTDRVNSYLSSYALGDNVEYGRVMANGAANLAGNNLSNTLYAGSGNNVLNGGSGTDTVSYYYATAGVTVSLAQTTAQATGGSGSDTLVSVEKLTGSNYNDTLIGNTGSNALNGGTGNDTLDGGAGNDTLTGGVGADMMTGGDGADVFDFNALSELGLSSTTWDVITDFVSGTDKIDLSTIDANAVLTGDQAFTFLGSNAFSTTDATGQLRFDSINKILYGSTDADTAAEFAIALTGVSSLSATDFVL